MKAIVLSALFAIAAAYDESEGPTKADNGELDEVVVYREADIKNGEKFSGWTNPLSWTDDGSADDTVVLQIKDKLALNLSKKHEENVSIYDSEPNYKFGDWTNVQQGAWVNLDSLRKHKHRRELHDTKRKAITLTQKKFTKKSADAFDGDTNTVSEYDDGHKFRTFDWGVPAGEEGAYKEPVW